MAEKGRKVEELQKTNPTNSLEAVNKGIQNPQKKPGQVGLWDQHSMDGIRKPPREERVDKGDRVFGGVSSPKVIDQTNDLYSPLRKVNPPAKKKEE